MKLKNRRWVQIFFLIVVAASVETDASWDWGKWDLDVLTHPHVCEAVVVGRLVPIKLLGDIKNENCDYYLIIAHEVLFGVFKECCVLEVPKGGIDTLDERLMTDLKEMYQVVGDEFSEGSWAPLFTRKFYLLFLRKKRDEFGFSSTVEGLCTYGVINGLNGIVGLESSCTEKRSRREIEKQYGIAMDRYANSVPEAK